MTADRQRKQNRFGREHIEPGVVKADFWHRTESGRIQCDLCPRGCALRSGQRGFCVVREARDEELVLASYGRASGFCIDPIEKKPLNHFYPGSSVLSFGTCGCNLGCRFCQNWDMSKVREVDDLNQWASPDDVAQAALKAGCRSVAFTYNEPIIFAEYAIDCAKANKERGIQSVAVTAGYIQPQARQAFFSVMDGVNIDLKAFSERFYRKFCYAHLDPILDTLRFLFHETDVWFEVTTLMIPGQNDSSDEIAKMCDWFVENLGPEVPLHFTAFHPDFKLTDVPSTSSQLLKRARNQAVTAGVKHVYTGNVHDIAGQSTYCASCGAMLIERNGYSLGRYTIDPLGNCMSCGYRVAGRFGETKGDWSGRAPIRLKTS
jgi:pyruvate formate lyase activating enzyme